MIRFKFIFLLMLCSAWVCNGQNEAISVCLKEFVDSGELSMEDVQYRISDFYTSNKSGLKYIYIQQTVDNIPIDLAINCIYIDQNNQARIQENRFLKNAKAKTSAGILELSPFQSVQNAAIDLGYSDQNSLRSIINTRSNNHFSAGFARNEITVNKVYIELDDSLVLCHQLYIEEKAKSDTWDMKIDIRTGKVVQKNNYTIYCRVDVSPVAAGHSTMKVPRIQVPQSNQNLEGIASYRVYPLPASNPTDGMNELILSPHNSTASPFGWHDTDGMEGAEFTITRGNNVFGYSDLGGTNNSVGDEPDGGTSLTFDFPHKINEEAENSKDASTVNLFYVSNMAHDLSYLLGFQEADGNYQANNYGKGGNEGDFVRVESMDGSGRNNANFSITSDGNPGRMQMYLFDKIRSLVSAELPAALVDNNFEAAEASFGGRIQNNPVQTEVVLAFNNDSEFPNQGCGPVISNVHGKIAMVDRGTCDFSEKVFNAQQAGAVMAIVCNIAGVDGGDGEDIFPMGAGAFAGSVNIPSVMMKKSDCDLIKITLNTGQSVVLSAKERPIDGPLSYDASFDNGISLHEYVHGISTRLTGGPSQAGCLNNVSDSNGDRRGDQMGEGWSDFFAMAWTTKAGDNGADPRGIGNYVLGEEKSGKGIRSYPYSTNMDVNPLTFGDIKVASVPHGVGTVWASMLWDLYWNFIDSYGFDPNYGNEESGNFKAAYIIMEAMKIQPCRPGFVDGRNAILEADQLLYNGDNEVRIWSVFARRGLGFYAEQGNTLDHRDGKEDFTIPPFITKEMVLNQETTKNVRPGELIDVNISLSNFTGIDQKNGVLKVSLSEGLTYVEGSSPVTPEINKGGLSFDVGDVGVMEEKKLSFSLQTSDDIASVRRFYDDVEGGANGWVVDQRKGSNIWRIDNTQSLSGNLSWYAPEAGTAENLQRLISPVINVTGEWPVFRFWHSYNIREAINGGFIEITRDGGQNWNNVTENLIIRNQYSNELPYLAFGTPNLQGYSGLSSNQEFIDSYIDLTDYKGSAIQLRFRFSQQPGFTPSSGKAGWYLDDFELLDLKTYALTTCFISDDIEVEDCTDPSEIVINTQTITAVSDLEIKDEGILIFPNPANETLYLEFTNHDLWNESKKLAIFSATGTEVYQAELNKGIKNIEIDTRRMISGIYFLKIRTGKLTISRSFQVFH